MNVKTILVLLYAAVIAFGGTGCFMIQNENTTTKKLTFKEKAKMVSFISHRGESKDAPENTLEAFELSNARDTDGMECDIHFTAEKILVCCHDFDTQRRAGVMRVVEETSLAELQSLDVSGGPDAFGGKYAGAKIPLFVDSLKTLKPGRKYYVEVKANDESVLPAMRADIEKSGIPMDQIVLISFHADIIDLARKYMPEIPRLWLAWVGKRQDGTLSHTYEDVFATLERIGATGLDVGGDDTLTPEFLKEVKARGYYLAIWTIDDEERCKYFIENGADAITSNRAAALKEAMCK